MRAVTNRIVPIEAPSALPEDLRSWLPADSVLALATEAADRITQGPAFPKARFEQFDASMMLTLLGYCYATNRLSSEDVEEAAANEDVVHDTLGFPDAQIIRRFRRAYRPWMLQCLIYILTKAVTEPAEMSRAPGRSGTSADIVGWSSRKIQRATLMDVADAD